MLVRHSFHYLLARGIPGLVNFAALAIYTRLLTAGEFGRYALILSIVGLVNVLFFQWLTLVVARFVPRSVDKPHNTLQHVLSLFLLLSAAALAVALAAGILWPVPGLAWLIALAAMLAIAQAWHELNLVLASARLEPGRYGRQLGAKAILSVLTGAVLAWLGWGAAGPVAGLILGSFLGWWLFSRDTWKNAPPRWPPPQALHEYRAYGLPLAITFGMFWITSSSDRLIIAALIDESAAGYYAVGYDLAQQSLGLLLSIVNTAAAPLAIRYLETEGVEAASRQMHHNGELMVALAMAGAAGLVAIGPQLIQLFVGSEFRSGALVVFPWIAVTAAVVGIKAFHFDIAFHLSRQSRRLLLTSGLAAGMSVALNFLLIPRYGIVGSAWASLAGFTLASVASAVLGKKVFPMPNPFPLLMKGLLVASATFLAARLASQWQVRPELQLACGLLLGGGAALAAAILLDVSRMRQNLMSRLLR
ncbi:hypothetical protein B1992_04120 [Pseudoxanthomonas broegbernensis]|uniref:Membrane protein involved in the export of O-antigen and teichoic acid n=1 Tax=Pseudoxanthomonas broegbernensis TaxID=83619 RepID=A0A7V8GNQ2_9GAMM|nr:lipopolysaccharide biosynthesis protein [Pseudoxanthomonas broegbernensis]KAF1687182.1 hypothetical protein B1992_04120 [Pseudoxanthomonas broegbernensis]MBB6065837.1 O-antigen/teichoic acid export membrane protein [Pseudoxanthomonas broegbernensis]